MNWLVTPLENGGTGQLSTICLIVICCSNACCGHCSAYSGVCPTFCPPYATCAGYCVD